MCLKWNWKWLRDGLDASDGITHSCKIDMGVKEGRIRKREQDLDPYGTNARVDIFDSV